ncbi:hypothetical protein QMK28_10650 [Streptomyces sp. H27-D2]|nr:hypothetical protein [Streptomyces sp. H27-D2]MEC4016757.1 hypothetical protein [Streptomyces sp. H27-D2]
MDAVEGGRSFTVTRDGHQIGELIPLRRRRRFMPRDEFAGMSRTAPGISLEAFRADQDRTDQGAANRVSPGLRQSAAGIGVRTTPTAAGCPSVRWAAAAALRG